MNNRTALNLSLFVTFTEHGPIFYNDKGMLKTLITFMQKFWMYIKYNYTIFEFLLD